MPSGGDDQTHERRGLERRVDLIEHTVADLMMDVQVLKKDQDSHHRLDDAQFRALTAGQDSLAHQITNMDTKFGKLSGQVDLLESVRDALTGGFGVIRYLGWATILGLGAYFITAMVQLLSRKP